MCPGALPLGYSGEQGLVINPVEKNETEFGRVVLWGVV